MDIKSAHEHTGSAEAVRPSLRNGFTAYNVLSPVTGLSCHRRYAEIASRETWCQRRGIRTTRLRRTHWRARLAHLRVHRIPLRVSWRLRIRPSGRGGMRKGKSLSVPLGKRFIFYERTGLSKSAWIFWQNSPVRAHDFSPWRAARWAWAWT